MAGIFLAIGLGAGVLSGIFGIGGGLLIVPALMYLGFSPHAAMGTSLAVLLPPVGLAAVLEYYRNGNVHMTAALLIALGVFGGGYVGSHLANRISSGSLRLGFGIFVVIMGISIVVGGLRERQKDPSPSPAEAIER